MSSSQWGEPGSLLPACYLPACLSACLSACQLVLMICTLVPFHFFIFSQYLFLVTRFLRVLQMMRHFQHNSWWLCTPHNPRRMRLEQQLSPKSKKTRTPRHLLPTNHLADCKMRTGLTDSRTHGLFIRRLVELTSSLWFIHMIWGPCSSPASTPGTMHSSTIVIPSLASIPSNDWTFVGGAQFS